MKGRHIKKDEVAGIAMDIKAGKLLPQIMLSWDCGHETVRRVKTALELIDSRASAREIYDARNAERITTVMADFVNAEIARLIAEEEEAKKKKFDETVFANNAIGLEKDSDFSINEVGYTLMRIETLLEEILKVWKV